MEGIQAGKRLQLDQPRRQPAIDLTNAEVDDEKIRVRGLVRHFQSGRDRILRMAGKLRRPHAIYDGRGRVRQLFRKRIGQENRRFGNPKIRRPLFRFIHAAQKRFVFFRREIGVETRTKFRVHQIR